MIPSGFNTFFVIKSTYQRTCKKVDILERSMEYILKVYTEKSFSKAANQLFITQPALSAIVKKEEERYGVSLFNRNVKPIVPTEAGMKYVHAALKIEKIEQGLEKELHSLSHTLTVGSGAYFCSNVLPALTGDFTKSRKKACKIKFIEGNAPELVELLQGGEVDFVISVDDRYGKNVSSQVLKQEMLLLAAPSSLIQDEALRQAAVPEEAIEEGTYLDPDYKPISLANFSKLPFILLGKGNDTYYRGRKMLHHAGLKPSSIIYMDQLQSSFLAAQTGRGLTFIRADFPRVMGNPAGLLFYKLDDPLTLRDVKIFYRSSAHLTPLAQEFLEYCETYFHKI